MMTKDIHMLHTPMEEIEHAPALWLWDYLRRSGARGFFLPLSGGADSAAVAAIVSSMARILMKDIEAGNLNTLKDLRRVTNEPEFNPTKYKDIVGKLLVTAYLGSENSSKDTASRAERLAEGIGALHYDLAIDGAYDAILKIFEKTTGKQPKF